MCSIDHQLIPIQLLQADMYRSLFLFIGDFLRATFLACMSVSDSEAHRFFRSGTDLILLVGFLDLVGAALFKKS